MESNLKEKIRDIMVCTDFTMFEVRVPIIFFPARRGFRHARMDVTAEKEAIIASVDSEQLNDAGSWDLKHPLFKATGIW